MARDIAAPLISSGSAVTPAAVAQDYSSVAAVIVGVWVCGSTALALFWLVRWLRVRRAVHDSRVVNLPFSIPVRASDTLIEPGIVGILRPVLLLPEGLEHRLTPAQLRAVLAHEECHVQRRDNLCAALHMFVEMVFWFHPLIWWLGARLIAERERACDEYVLRVGHLSRAYAEGILSVCEFYLESQLPIVAGISGANLRKRVLTIMKNQHALAMSGTKRVLLAALGCAAVAIPLVSGIVGAPLASAREVTDAAQSRRAEGELLLLAAGTGDLGEVRTLLDRGADVNHENDHGITALTQAAQRGQTNLVQELLARGAHVNHQRAPGDTALMLAAMGGHESTVQTLLAAGANANLQSGRGGMTALSLAAKSGNERTVQLLLDAHADVDSQLMLGETPLLIAARAGDARIVELLLDHGADIHHKSKTGDSALGLAAQTRNVAVAQVLLARGATPGE
jgi:ankyrin repeat protein/beta-lactamase regulating signal transducer with metallopeptidase domain